MKNDNLKNQYRVNEQIRVNEVRIVGDDIESMVVPTSKALRMAEERGVDLVEISPTAVPPVCRLIEYSKFLYQQKKRTEKSVRFFCGRDDKIRTCDLLNPIQARYQTALHPDAICLPSSQAFVIIAHIF